MFWGKKVGGMGTDRQPGREYATYQFFLLRSPQELLGRVADIGVCGVVWVCGEGRRREK